MFIFYKSKNQIEIKFQNRFMQFYLQLMYIINVIILYIYLHNILLKNSLYKYNY